MGVVTSGVLAFGPVGDEADDIPIGRNLAAFASEPTAQFAQSSSQVANCGAKAYASSHKRSCDFAASHCRNRRRCWRG
jgi:hypothetical protein